MQNKSTKKTTGNLQKQLHSHKVVFVFCSLAVFLSVFIFINNYLSRIRASTTKAFVSFSSTSVIVEAEQPTTGGNVNKISAFDLTLTTDGTELITTVGNPSTYPAGDTTIFTPVIAASGLPATTVHIAYVIQKPTAELPVAISIPISTDGAGNVSLEAASTQEIVGYIANATDNVYQITAATTTPPPNTPSTTDTPPLPVTKPRAVINFPAPSNYTLGQTQTETLTIKVDQPVSGISSNKVSAFDLTISATGVLEIAALGSPAAVPGNATGIFTEVIVPTALPATKVRFAYVIQLPTAQLPTTIQIPVTIKSTSDGSGSLILDNSANQEVAGPIIDSTDTNYQVVMEVTGNSPTATPEVSGPPDPQTSPDEDENQPDPQTSPSEDEPQDEDETPETSKTPEAEESPESTESSEKQNAGDEIKSKGPPGLVKQIERLFPDRWKNDRNFFWQILQKILSRFARKQ